MELLYWIYDALNDAYFYIVGLLLLAYWLIKKHRPWLKEIIVSSNTLSLLTYLIFIYNSLYILYAIIQPFNDERDIFFKYRIAGPYSAYYWIPFINSMIIFILLLFRKSRNSIWITVWMVISSAPFIYDYLFIWLLTSFRDYLPSSWSVQNSNYLAIYPYIIYIFFLAATYYIRKYFKNKMARESTNLNE
jgi:hypothetical protein